MAELAVDRLVEVLVAWSESGIPDDRLDEYNRLACESGLHGLEIQAGSWKCEARVHG